jgi:hypothetical protein
MGQGLYGENQGNESRSAGRHNESVMMAERILDNELVEGEIVARWRMWYQAAKSGINARAWDVLEADVEKVRKQWLESRIEGEDIERWRSAVLRRINAMLAQASYNGR